jgi:hypothetical protein
MRGIMITAATNPRCAVFVTVVKRIPPPYRQLTLKLSVKLPKPCAGTNLPPIVKGTVRHKRNPRDLLADCGALVRPSGLRLSSLKERYSRYLRLKTTVVQPSDHVGLSVQRSSLVGRQGARGPDPRDILWEKGGPNVADPWTTHE